MVNLKRNKFYGYYEVDPKPTVNELRIYYEKKYYQNEKGAYAKQYTEQELLYFHNKIIQNDYVIKKIQKSTNNRRLLDIGCGEGFTLNYYYGNDWQVTGIDFSEFAIKAHHPHLLPYLIKGNVFEEIQKQVDKGMQYDIVWLGNVLEHVIDPEKLIEQCYRLSNVGGVLVIEVPNDFSSFQKELLKEEIVDKKYWVAYPDHLTYFNNVSLVHDNFQFYHYNQLIFKLLC